MKIVILALLACVSVNAPAQKHTAFGLKGGLNIDNLKPGNESQDDYHPRASFHIGGLVQIQLTQQIALQPELVFSGQGARYHTKYPRYDVADVPFDYNLNYLNLPVMLQFLVARGFCLETGPQVGFLLSAKTKNKYDEQDIKDRLKGVDLSWGFGAGYRVKHCLGLNVRYNPGLSDIDDSNGLSAKNRVFQVGLFYLFDKGDKN